MARTMADKLATADIKAQGRPNKYHAQRCPCNQGETAHWHDSLAERQRCFVLQQRAHLGEIRDLQRQPRYPLIVSGVVVGHFRPDFEYTTATEVRVVEDVKGGKATKTEAYRLRKGMFEAYYGIPVLEVE